MHSNCTKNLLNLEDILIKKVVQADSFVKVFIEIKPHSQICLHCGRNTKRIHDYRSKIIKDLPFQMKHTYLILKKRRYVSKRFFKFAFLFGRKLVVNPDNYFLKPT